MGTNLPTGAEPCSFPLENGMPRFQMTVTETYRISFEVEADDADQAAEQAEAMAVERTYPPGHQEDCSRTIAASEQT